MRRKARMTNNPYQFNDSLGNVIKPVAEKIGPAMGNAVGTGAEWFSNLMTKLFNPSALAQGQQPVMKSQAYNKPDATPTPVKQMSAPTPTSTPVKQISNPISSPSSTQQQYRPQVLGTTDTHSQFQQLLENHVFPVTDVFGIPRAVVAAQAAQESGYGTSPLSKQNNLFGLKAHSYPGFAHFDTPEDAARYYAQTVQSLSGGDLKKYKNDPLGLLKAIQSGKSHYEGDNQNPMQYVYDVSHNPLWRQYQGGNPSPTNPWGQ